VYISRLINDEELQQHIREYEEARAGHHGVGLGKSHINWDWMPGKRVLSWDKVMVLHNHFLNNYGLHDLNASFPRVVAWMVQSGNYTMCQTMHKNQPITPRRIEAFRQLSRRPARAMSYSLVHRVLYPETDYTTNDSALDLCLADFVNAGGVVDDLDFPEARAFARTGCLPMRIEISHRPLPVGCDGWAVLVDLGVDSRRDHVLDLANALNVVGLNVIPLLYEHGGASAVDADGSLAMGYIHLTLCRWKMCVQRDVKFSLYIHDAMEYFSNSYYDCTRARRRQRSRAHGRRVGGGPQVVRARCVCRHHAQAPQRRVRGALRAFVRRVVGGALRGISRAVPIRRPFRRPLLAPLADSQSSFQQPRGNVPGGQPMTWPLRPFLSFPIEFHRPRLPVRPGQCQRQSQHQTKTHKTKQKPTKRNKPTKRPVSAV